MKAIRTFWVFIATGVLILLGALLFLPRHYSTRPNPCAVPLQEVEVARRFHGAYAVFCENGRWLFKRRGRKIPLLETYRSLSKSLLEARHEGC